VTRDFGETAFAGLDQLDGIEVRDLTDPLQRLTSLRLEALAGNLSLSPISRWPETEPAVRRFKNKD
jgi:hypothetical protein